MNQATGQALFSPYTLFALAVLLIVVGAIGAGLLLKTIAPDLQGRQFCKGFLIAGFLFRTAYRIYDSLKSTGSFQMRYLEIDGYVLMVVFSLVMWLVMYCVELNIRLVKTRETVKQAAEAIKSAAGEAQAGKNGE